MNKGLPTFQWRIEFISFSDFCDVNESRLDVSTCFHGKLQRFLMFQYYYKIKYATKFANCCKNIRLQ